MCAVEILCCRGTRKTADTHDFYNLRGYEKGKLNLRSIMAHGAKFEHNRQSSEALLQSIVGNFKIIIGISLHTRSQITFYVAKCIIQYSYSMYKAMCHDEA